MIRSKKINASILLLAFFISTAALLITITPTTAIRPAVAQNAEETIIVIGTTDSISNLDPADAYDYFSSNTIVQITHGLMEMPIDSTDAVKGPIVESYEVSSDAKNYTFTLKQGIKFSDGTPFNATALKWNIDRAMALGGDPSFLLTDVVNHTEVIDDYTFRFVLNKPDATFLQRLTYTVAWPISPNSLPNNQISGDPDHIPAGLGPYKITSWTKDTELILEPNPYYFGEKPKNDKVIIKFYSDASALLTALENGEIDVAHRQFGPDEISDIMNNPELEYATKDTAGIRYMIINVEAHPNKNVRQAIAAAIDRKEIVQTVFNNLNDPLYSMVPTIFSSHIDAYEDGPVQAHVEGNMTAAGYSTTNKYKLDLWYTPTHYGDTEASVAQLLEQQLEATGYFDVTLKNAEWSTYLDQLGTMGAFLLGWWFDYPDPSNYIDPFVGSGAFSLGTNYSSAQMNQYIDTMLTNPDPAARKQAIINAQKLMAEDVPLVPLFTMIKQFVAYQKGVTGVVLEPSENLHYSSITKTEEAGGGFIPGFEMVPAFMALVLITLSLTVTKSIKRRK